MEKLDRGLLTIELSRDITRTNSTWQKARGYHESPRLMITLIVENKRPIRDKIFAEGTKRANLFIRKSRKKKPRALGLWLRNQPGVLAS